MMKKKESFIFFYFNFHNTKPITIGSELFF